MTFHLLIKYVVRCFSSVQFVFSVFLIGCGYFYSIGGTLTTYSHELPFLLDVSMSNEDFAIITILGSTISCSWLFIQDYQSGYTKYLMTRVPVTQYVSALAGACFIVGGVANVLGRLLLLLIGLLNGFSGLAEYNAGGNGTYYWYAVFPSDTRPFLYVGAIMLCCFLFGGFLAVLGLVISVLCCDFCAGIVLPYIVLFMDKVVPYGLCDKLNIVNVWTGRANSEIWWISCTYSILLCFVYCLFLNRIMKWKVAEYVYGQNDKNNNA